MRYCLDCRKVGAGVEKCKRLSSGACRIVNRGFRAKPPNDTITDDGDPIMEGTSNMNEPLPGDAGPPLRSTKEVSVVNLGPAEQEKVEDTHCPACGHAFVSGQFCGRNLSPDDCAAAQIAAIDAEAAAMNKSTLAAALDELLGPDDPPMPDEYFYRLVDAAIDSLGSQHVREVLLAEGAPNGHSFLLAPVKRQACARALNAAMDEAEAARRNEPVKMAGEPTTRAGDFLRIAAGIVDGARNTTHGDKERSFVAIADLWNAYLRARRGGITYPVQAKDVAAMMVLLKFARAEWGEFVPDHAIDAAGYSAIFGELAEAQQKGDLEDDF